MSNIFLILLLSLSIKYTSGDNFFFKEEKKIKVEIEMINPCGSLNNVRPYREETVLEKIFHNPGHNRFMNGVFDYLKEQCDSTFEKLMAKSISDLEAYRIRSKRSIAHVAGFVAKTVFEYALTNFLSSLHENDQDSNSLDHEILEESLRGLTKNRLSSPEGVRDTRLIEINAISPSSNHHVAETTEFSNYVNPLLWAYQLTINEMIAGAADLETIAHRAKSGQLAAEEVGELMNDKDITNLRPDHTEILSVFVHKNNRGYLLSITFLEKEQYYILFPSIIVVSALIVVLIILYLLHKHLRDSHGQTRGLTIEEKQGLSSVQGELPYFGEMVTVGKIIFEMSMEQLDAPNHQGQIDDPTSPPMSAAQDSRLSSSTISVQGDEQLSRQLDDSLHISGVSQAVRRSSRLSSSTVSVRGDDQLLDHSSRVMSHRIQAQRERRMLAWRNQQNVIVRPRGRADLSIVGEAFVYDPLLAYREHPYLNFGSMNSQCSHCRALKFIREAEGFCCSKGKVVCDAIDSPPGFLDTLFSNDRPQSKQFVELIRRYNACFAMTSMGVRGFVDESVAPMTFRIQGQVYHRIGGLLPEANVPPTYLQIYFMGDSEMQIDRRTNLFAGVDRNIVSAWQSVLQHHNKLIRSFKTLIESAPRSEQRIVLRSDNIPQDEHPGRFHLPASEQVAVLMVDGEYNQRDIVLRAKDNRLQRIYETHRYYDALQYPIIFWRGQATYHIDLRQHDRSTGQQLRGKISSMDFYQYHLMPRADHRNYLLRCGPLLNQFIVDMWAKIEAERLRFLRLNQATLRADTYVHLTDAIAADRDPNQIGTRVILPSTFIGSPRHMHEYAQDALALVGRHGGPDLFITVTCNPNWTEIKENLFTGQTVIDRHDIVARVFRQKLLVLRDLIQLHNIFGPITCWMYSVEWQKRGLPHAHMLFWLKDRLRPEQIDSVICAEIPDSTVDPELYHTVTTFMIHGPCIGMNRNAVCIDERGVCSKKYPRHFLRETVTGDDGYPCYRRRSPTDGGRTFEKRFHGDRITVDNRWVVPYNPLLSRMLDCHINVEYCTSVKSIKYLFKYVTKGSDLAILELRGGNRPIVGNVPLPEQPDENDEIQLYQVGRYVSTDEAIWRIYGFLIHDRYPNVIKLQVHLENGQRVSFTASTARGVSERGPPRTTLTAFFELNRNDQFARTLLYSEIPSYYTWEPRSRSWEPRSIGSEVQGYTHVKKSDTIGRVYGVHPNYHECFHLRLLLNNVRGATSFIDIRTINGRVYSSFRDACLELNLLESDAHWIGALADAARCQMPTHMRQLLATILCYCTPSDPLSIWVRFRNDLSQDFLHRERRRRNQNLDFNDFIYNKCLQSLEDITLSMRNVRLCELGLPSPNRARDETFNNEVEREISYDVAEMQAYYNQNLPRMVDDQRSAFNCITSAIDLNKGGIFFLDAPGGTGKTFLINLILNHVRLNGDIAVATAASGIASTLLFGGRTAHSTFNLPLKPDKEARVTMASNSPKAIMLKRCKLIVWDECTMVNKAHFESLNVTLQDITRKSSLMGGIVVLLSGDFRQTLPVVKRGTPADTINASLKRSVLWKHVVRLTLTTNMRVSLRGDVNAVQFSNLLLQIGNGTYPFEQGDKIRLNSNLCCHIAHRSDLLNRVFPNFSSNSRDKNWLAERALLAPLNETVDELNSIILNRLASRERTYFSIDSTSDPEDIVNFPVEVLNSLTPAGMPPHRLTLKEGSVIILIRNFRPPCTCNGTLLFIRKLHNHMIEGEILKGAFKGEIVFIPRFPLDSDDLFVKFRRRQFPVRLAFALSVNKSQGQSYKIVGVDLSKPCFSHGQLYVAFSRVGSPACLFVHTTDGQTRNIVFSRALI